MTLYKYIFNEIWPTFLVSMFISVSIILATDMLTITEMIVNRGVDVGDIIGMLVYLLPDIISFSLPAVNLIAVVVAFLRFSSDSEIIALKSSGISLYQMLPPVVVFSLLSFLLAIFISFIAIPWGNRSFKDLIFKIAQSEADLGIKERVFSEPFDNVVFYVNSFSSRERLMKDVFVVDRRDKAVTNTIIAKEARILLYPEERIIRLHFLKGTIFLVEKNLQSSKTIRFNTYDLNIGLQDIMAKLESRQENPNEMSTGELIRKSGKVSKGDKQYNKIMIELLERFSLPLAVFLMGMIGVPLGAQIRARGRSTGIGISLAVFSIYYILLGGTRNICTTGIIPPAMGVWIPDLFLLMCCVYLFRRVAHERPINFLASLRTKGV